jgi:hypothetical protein
MQAQLRFPSHRIAKYYHNLPDSYYVRAIPLYMEKLSQSSAYQCPVLWDTRTNGRSQDIRNSEKVPGKVFVYRMKRWAHAISTWQTKRTQSVHCAALTMAYSSVHQSNKTRDGKHDPGTDGSECRVNETCRRMSAPHGRGVMERTCQAQIPPVRTEVTDNQGQNGGTCPSLTSSFFPDRRNGSEL